MAERGDVFLREVDEELRREQIKSLFERYGLYFVAMALVILFGIGGMKWWQYRQASLIEAAGQRYEAAARLAATGQTEEATKAFAAIATEGPKGYGALARLRAAGALATSGKTAEAVAQYDSLAGNADADPILRDYAVVQSVMARLGTADWTEIENRLTPVIVGNSPWRSMAREVRALAALQAGKTDEARKQLEALLGDRSAPPAMIERVQLLLGVLTDQDAGKVTPAPAAGTAVVPKADATGEPVKDAGKAPAPAATK